MGVLSDVTLQAHAPLCECPKTQPSWGGTEHVLASLDWRCGVERIGPRMPFSTGDPTWGPSLGCQISDMWAIAIFPGGWGDHFLTVP